MNDLTLPGYIHIHIGIYRCYINEEAGNCHISKGQRCSASVNALYIMSALPPAQPLWASADERHRKYTHFFESHQFIYPVTPMPIDHSS